VRRAQLGLALRLDSAVMAVLCARRTQHGARGGAWKQLSRAHARLSPSTRREGQLEP
jgi:hypothetical protein